MTFRKKILWLVSWYPNKFDAFDGDFIQRHARAAALHHDIHVLFLKQDPVQEKEERSVIKSEGLTEEIIYLPKKKGLVGKMQNFRRWEQLHKKRITDLVQHQQPSAIHVHVPWKVGLIARWAKKRFGIPYFVTEHWGIYNNVVADNIHTKPKLVRALLKRIYHEAAAFVPVSKFLGEAVNQTVVRKEFSVIPNAVDTALFHPASVKHERFTFIHVSNMAPVKNVEGILQAFKDFLAQSGADAQLVLVGNRDDRYVLFAQKLHFLNRSVFFRGEIPYPDVAKEMQRSHVLLLNSHMENSPCVIGEALCCGLPVIATAVGGIPELVNETNGLLTPSRNSSALTTVMLEMHRHYSRYLLSQVATDAAQKFSLPSVAGAFSKLYGMIAA